MIGLPVSLELRRTADAVAQAQRRTHFWISGRAKVEEREKQPQAHASPFPTPVSVDGHTRERVQLFP
jgi:hypothetical protein